MSPHTTHQRHPARRHGIAKHEINALPLTVYTGHIHVIDSDAKMGSAAHALGREKVLGFDTETRPAFKVGESYPPALVQLAANDAVYIFQLRHIKSYEPLAAILADAKVLKAGIAVRDDIIKLKSVFSRGDAGFVELADQAAAAGIQNAGLRGLAALIFGYRISKATKLSAWHATTLTQAQIVYAATDAWICREIYFALLDIASGKRQVTSPGHGAIHGKGHRREVS